jgi:hypothetical protein
MYPDRGVDIGLAMGEFYRQGIPWETVARTDGDHPLDPRLPGPGDDLILILGVAVCGEVTMAV